MKKDINQQTEEVFAEALLALAQMTLRFARVDRVTLYEDGTTLESDTDHTVMLSLSACALASALIPELDIGKVAQYALVHDLVEVYAGDTPTFGVSLNNKQAKDAREHQALLQIKKEFAGTFPWIAETIERYESLKDSESRFVKTLDKAMPKLTHILNHGAYYKKEGKTKNDLEKFYRSQYVELSQGYGEGQDALLPIMRRLVDITIADYE